MTIKKKDIIDVIHKRVELPKNRTAKIVESLLGIIKSTLADGESIMISRFGKFCVKEKKNKRHSRAGDDLFHAEERWVTFCCSRVLKERLNHREMKDV